MKIQIITTILGVMAFTLQVRSQVVFEEAGMQEVLQRAKSENKLVFMDCYTSWCGPCKKMLKEVFSREDVGDYMNNHFVNYKKDMEKGEGKELAKAYGVEVYPTFFVLDTEGKVIHKMVGGMPAEEFLENIRNSQGKNSLKTYQERYQQGERKSQFVIKYMELLSKAYMKEELRKVFREYWNTMDDRAKCSEPNWEVVKRYVRDVKSPEYIYLLEHKADFEATVGKEAVDTKLFGDLQPLIGNHCNDMIFKNRPEDSEALREYRQIVEKSDIQRKGELLDLIDYIQAYVDNNLSLALKIYKHKFSKLESEERFNATLQLNGMLIGKGNANHCKKGLKAIKETIKACEWSEKDPLFMTIINGLTEKMNNE